MTVIFKEIPLLSEVPFIRNTEYAEQYYQETINVSFDDENDFWEDLRKQLKQRDFGPFWYYENAMACCQELSHEITAFLTCRLRSIEDEEGYIQPNKKELFCTLLVGDFRHLMKNGSYVRATDLIFNSEDNKYYKIRGEY